jgi:hypothetical protein
LSHGTSTGWQTGPGACPQPGEAREPAQLDAKTTSSIGEARQPDDELASQSAQGVVGAGVAEPIERQPGETRDLIVEERPDDPWTAVRLVVVESRRHARNVSATG